MTALSDILSNAFVAIAFLFCLRLGIRGMWRAARGDKYSPKYRR